MESLSQLILLKTSCPKDFQEQTVISRNLSLGRIKHPERSERIKSKKKKELQR